MQHSVHQANKKRWGSMGGLIAGAMMLPWLLGPVIGIHSLAQVPAGVSQVSVPTPHSGEERLVDGQFARVADPRNPTGPATEGWQQAMLQSMAAAAQSGNEQVMLIFSRQGCGWCDRFLPVLREAIQAHATSAGDAEAQSIGVMPLRVFVLDAAEFPGVMQQMRIEGFPASLVFGKPGVKPRFASGFLELESLEKMLRIVALLEPEPPQEASPLGAVWAQFRRYAPAAMMLGAACVYLKMTLAQMA